MTTTATSNTRLRRPGSRSVSPRRPARSCPASCPVRLQVWDGSVAGPEDAPLVVLRSPDALRRLLWHPGELGAAQAYVTGELDVPEQDGGTSTRPSPTPSRSAPSAGCPASGSRRARSSTRCAPPRPRRARPAPGAARLAGADRAGCTASLATGRRSATTTTSPTSSTP